MFLLYIFCFLFVIIPLGLIWSGFAVSQLWQWFIIPIFNVSELSIAQAMGIGLLISYVTHQQIEEEIKTPKEQMVKSALLLFFKPAVALSVGWIISKWV